MKEWRKGHSPKWRGACPQSASGLSLAERWQAMTHVFLTSQMHAIIPYGFSPDNKGLRAFTIAFETMCRSHPNKAELQQLNQVGLVLGVQVIGIARSM
jgi:hypothetical protein